jgi:hypothetical protein
MPLRWNRGLIPFLARMSRIFSSAIPPHPLSTI